MKDEFITMEKKLGVVKCSKCGTKVFINRLVEYFCPRCRTLLWVGSDKELKHGVVGLYGIYAFIGGKRTIQV